MAASEPVIVPLTRGKVAIISPEDRDRVFAHRWYATPVKRKDGSVQWYAKQVCQKTVLLHRFILNAPPDKQVDHRNRDGLDCQRPNLRLATSAQNRQNMVRVGKSGYKGVHQKSKNTWVAVIQKDGQVFHLGWHRSPTAAARVYDAKARELFGEFGRPNFPTEAVNA